MRKLDAMVLIVTIGLAVLSAGAIGLGGRMHAKTLMCTVNLEKIGQSIAIYTDDFDGCLPLPERYADAVPSIESTYLLSKTNTSAGPKYVHLACLYGAGYFTDGQMLFCPALPGWRGDSYNFGVNNGTYLGAVHSITKKFADITAGVSQPNQGWKATRGYCYWPLSKKMATQTDIDRMYSASRSRYVVGLPISATKADDLNPTKPMVTDNKFHSIRTGVWTLNCLHPDGHVTLQDQPKAPGLNGNGVQGTWGMYSLYENCQLPSDICNGVSIISDLEKPYHLASGITPTEFAWALQP